MDSRGRGDDPNSTRDAGEPLRNSTIAEPPTELLRDIATRLKSLAKVLPYDDYAAIVHRIARVRWRCEQSERSDVSGATQSSASKRDIGADIATDDAETRIWCAAMAYSRWVMQAMKHGNLIDRARQTQTQAVEIQVNHRGSVER